MTDYNVKYLAIIIDDFSSRSLNYDNVVIYDYADYFITTSQDQYFTNVDQFSPLYLNQLDYGDYDSSSTIIADSFYTNVELLHLNYLAETNTTLQFLDTNPFSPYYGWAEYLKTDNFTSLISRYPSDTSTPNHGDWVLDSFIGNLDNPEDVHVLAVDIDFTSNHDINYLFNTKKISPFNGEEVSYLKFLYQTAFQDYIYEEGNFYNLIGFNASFGGNSVELESETITEFLSDDMVIVQAAPNTSQSGINWGNYFPNVINVGAWNTDTSGYYMAGNYEQLATVDISANGYVTKYGWGDNFGTSFAAPRVFADVINLFDELIPDTISSETLPENIDLTDEEYTSIVNTIIERISTNYEMQIQGSDQYFGPIEVLTDTIEDYGEDPVSIPYSKDQYAPPPGNYELVQISDVRLYDQNFAPTSISLDTFSVTENDIGGHIANITGEDPDGDSLTFSVLSGQDSGMVEIDGTTVKFKSGVSADYEQDQLLEFTLRVTDSNGLYLDQEFSLNVNDVYENIAPVFTSLGYSSINENSSVENIVYVAEATDVETFTFFLDGNDKDLLSINSSTGEVKLLNSPDYEIKSSYTFEVIASDGEFSSKRYVTLSVLDEFDGRIFDQTDNYYEINVNQTSTVYGLYDGNNGYDHINFVVDNGETNGARVDFTAGIEGEVNSAFVSSYGVDAGSVGFDINDFEKLSLTDQTDYVIITDAVGVNLTDQFNTDYFTTSQSVLTIDPGEAGTGIDRLDIDKDSQIHLSYESLNSNTGINVSVSETTATVTGIDVNTFADGLSGTGQVIDRLTTTNLGDTVTNNSSLGMVVDLGNAINGETDGFIGSVDVDAIDVLDARDAYNLNFTALTNSYDVRVTGTNQSNEQKVKTDLKQIDMIMVRDVAAYGITDVDFYIDLSDIYGKEQIQGLGAVSIDTYGEGYDVQTSAKVSQFGNDLNLRVYYDGKHTDFVDTGDIIDTTLQGQWSMVDGATSNGANWEQQVADSNPTGGEGSFFIVVGGKKIGVTYVDGEWIADNKALSIAQGVTRGNSGTDTITTNFGTMSEQQFIASLADRYGLSDLTDPNNYSFTDAIYLSATEQQINEILDVNGNGTLSSAKAFNFGFYTKVNIGDTVVNLKISQNGSDPQKFNLNWDDVDLMIERFYNRVETVGEGVSAGGKAANFVKVDNAKDIVMGNGGNDTYVIGSNNAGGKVAGGKVLEYGDVSTAGGFLNSEGDSVNFEDIESITKLNFVRGKDRNERADSSLFISEDGGSDATVLFGNFNPYLDFRRIEYLTIDDAANNNKIFEISVDGNGGTDDSGKDLAWDNEIVVADNDGDTIYADGGTDVLVGGQGSDTFNLSNVLDGSTVYIENFTTNDNAILKAGSDVSSDTTLDGVLNVSLNSTETYSIYTDDEQLLIDNMIIASS